jgi:hypothetical protein
MHISMTYLEKELLVIKGHALPMTYVLSDLIAGEGGELGEIVEVRALQSLPGLSVSHLSSCFSIGCGKRDM